MTHIPELAEMSGGGVAVGWIHPGYPYAQGPVSAEFLDRLKEFVSRAREGNDALGWGPGLPLPCRLCDKAVAAGAFGVLNDGQLYSAPQMIVHFIEHHGYAPPREFIEAVLSGPLPGTPEYTAAAAPFKRDMPA